MTAASGIPYKFAEPWGTSATSSYITDPIPATASGGNASQAAGFPPITAANTGAGGIPPNIADFNGLGFYLSAWAQWQQMGGPVSYDSTLSTNIGGYPKGAVLQSTAVFGQFWQSTTDNNTSDPDTGGANWQRLPIGAAAYSSSVSVNTTLTVASWGQFIFVNNGVTVTTPAVSVAAGLSIGFLFGSGCRLVLGSGSFSGGGLSGTSISPPTNSFIFIQADGASWKVISASPDILGYAALAGATFTGAVAVDNTFATTSTNFLTGGVTVMDGIQIGSSTPGWAGPISTTTPGVQVLGTGFGSSEIYSNTSVHPPLELGVNYTYTSGDILGFYYGTTRVGGVQTDGSLIIISGTSDANLKIKRSEIANSGEIVDGIEALWFNWRTDPDGTQQPGFFAQQLHSVYPWAVVPGKGLPGDDDFRAWSVDKSVLMPVVIAELKDSRKRIAALEAAIARLLER